MTMRVSAVTAAQWACPPGYRDALQLARLILTGATLDSDSHMGGQSFTRVFPGRSVGTCSPATCDDLADSRLCRRERRPQRARAGTTRTGRHDRRSLADRRRDRPANRLAVGPSRQYKRRVLPTKTCLIDSRCAPTPWRSTPTGRDAGLPDHCRGCHNTRITSHDRGRQTPADRLAGLAHNRRTQACRAALASVATHSLTGGK